MARIAALVELHSVDRRRSCEARNGQGRNTAPDGDVLREQVCEDSSTTPQGKALKKIASLPRTRRDKVLDLRRQIAAGTYQVGGRLDKAMDRVLEALTR
jgi:anti-sigma28 factor (negative regulator of flagellin synthesis)